MTTVVLETQKITKELCVLIVIYTTGDWNFITLITKLKLFHIKVTEPDPEQCLPMMINVLLSNIFSIPFLCIILNLQTLVMAGLWSSVRRPGPGRSGQKKHLGCLCVFFIHIWDVEPIELYFESFSLMICFQNKYMDNAIYCLRTKVYPRKEIGYPDWTDFIKEMYKP